MIDILVQYKNPLMYKLFFYRCSKSNVFIVQYCYSNGLSGGDQTHVFQTYGKNALIYFSSLITNLFCIREINNLFNL